MAISLLSGSVFGQKMMTVAAVMKACSKETESLTTSIGKCMIDLKNATSCPKSCAPVVKALQSDPKCQSAIHRYAKNSGITLADLAVKMCGKN